MSEAKPDIRQMGVKLRRQVCELLKLDPEKLSAGDEVLVARVGALKLLVSDLEAAQLRGERIDVGEYVRASEALENAVRTNHRMSEMGTPEALELARAKLRELLNVVQKDPDDPDAELSETEQLRARVAELEQENLALKWGGQRSADPAAEPAPRSERQSPSQSPPTNVTYLPSRTADGKPPAHYLKQTEPWEDFYNGGGSVVCPTTPLIDPHTGAIRGWPK